MADDTQGRNEDLEQDENQTDDEQVVLDDLTVLTETRDQQLEGEDNTGEAGDQPEIEDTNLFTAVHQGDRATSEEIISDIAETEDIEIATTEDIVTAAGDEDTDNDTAAPSADGDTQAGSTSPDTGGAGPEAGGGGTGGGVGIDLGAPPAPAGGGSGDDAAGSSGGDARRFEEVVTDAAAAAAGEGGPTDETEAAVTAEADGDDVLDGLALDEAPVEDDEDEETVDAEGVRPARWCRRRFSDRRRRRR